MNLCWILLTTLFTFVELNCENLFDYRHEEGKDDMEWTVTSPRHWNKGRYWRKLNNIGQEIISCGETPSLSRGEWAGVGLLPLGNCQIWSPYAKLRMTRSSKI